MQKMMLAVISSVTGGVMLLIFGFSVLLQCAPVTAAQSPPLSLPCAVEGTELTALHLAYFQGPFWEDDSEDEVTNIAALVVENTGDLMCAEGAVTLEWEDTQMVFELSALPPGAQALVLEKSRQAYRTSPPVCCYGWARKEYPENMGQVAVEEPGGITIRVTNISDEPLPVVLLRYKSYDTASGLYIGGITYTAELRNMLPGETRTITPYHYVFGSSKVVCVTTYTDE